MAVSVNGSLQNKSPFADNYYYAQPNSSMPWPTVADAHNGIPSAYRGLGKKFMVGNSTSHQEYWYNGGVELINLVPVVLNEKFSYVQPTNDGNLIL